MVGILLSRKAFILCSLLHLSIRWLSKLSTHNSVGKIISYKYDCQLICLNVGSILFAVSIYRFNFLQQNLHNFPLHKAFITILFPVMKCHKITIRTSDEIVANILWTDSLLLKILTNALQKNCVKTRKIKPVFAVVRPVLVKISVCVWTTEWEPVSLIEIHVDSEGSDQTGWMRRLI